MTLSAWTDDRVSQLKSLWNDGLSHGAIAAEMAVSRNTICGKVARLKLPGRAPRMNETARQERKLARMKRNAEAQRVRRAERRGTPLPPSPAATPRSPRPVFVGSLEIPFGDLRSHCLSRENQCRYIAAEIPSPDYLACGNPTLPGESWCDHHHQIVFNYTKPTAHRNTAEASV